MLRSAVLAALVALPLSASAQHAGHTMPAGDDGTPSTDLILGRIDVRTSATGEAAREIETGMLALHSFWYDEARDHFRAAERLDPGAALALWGEAATYDHPLWGQHDSTAARAVFARVDSLRAAGALHASPREAGYLEALQILFAAGPPLSARRDLYADATARLATADPTDDEAAVFAALAAMSQDDFDLATDVEPVAAALEAVYRRNPKHPGAVHYLIHVYDSPGFAERGLPAAEAYAALAPESSHALHMPSHIFRELGLWTEVEASNRAAYDASVAWQMRTNRPVAARDYHALSWLLDALLAQGRFADARAVVATAEADARLAAERGEALGAPAMASLGAVATVAMTERDAGLTPTVPPLGPEVDPDAMPPGPAIVDVALHALLARQDSLFERSVARMRSFASIPELASYAAEIETEGVYLEALHLSLHGDGAATDRAREAVRLDAVANPNAPPASPAHALLGDLLLASGDAAGSLALYAPMAETYPHHADYDLGVARASVALGDTATASDHYARVLATWAHADAGLPAAAEARAYLAAHPAP